MSEKRLRLKGRRDRLLVLRDTLESDEINWFMRQINDVQPHLISNTVSFMPLSFKYP